MANENDILKSISDEQLAKIRPAARKFSPIWIASTRDCAGNKQLPAGIASKKLHTAYLFKGISLFLFGGGSFLLVKEAIYNPQDKLGLLIFLACMFGSIFLFMVYQFFFNKKINYTIHIDNAGIRLRGDDYTWRDISAIAILIRGSGRYSSAYLVIATGDSSNYKLYSLRLFVTYPMGRFPKKLARWVEYFRKKI